MAQFMLVVIYFLAMYAAVLMRFGIWSPSLETLCQIRLVDYK